MGGFDVLVDDRTSYRRRGLLIAGPAMLPLRYWHEMTTLDFSGGDTARWIAVLPVAAIEQHGPHLPVYTDACIAEGLIRRSIELLPGDLPVTFLPLQPIGKSDEHIAFPGSISAGWETTTRLWLEIGDSIARAGLKKLILLTSHGGNVPMIDVVARELRLRHAMLVVASSWARFGCPPRLLGSSEAHYGIHGGEAETSVMLHLRPDLVRMDKAVDFRSSQLDFIEEFTHLRGHGPIQFGWMMQDLNSDGAAGNASAATADKGKAIVDHQAGIFVELCRDVHAFDPARLKPR
jgi:creatinine amidohydrolase